MEDVDFVGTEGYRDALARYTAYFSSADEIAFYAKHKAEVSERQQRLNYDGYQPSDSRVPYARESNGRGLRSDPSRKSRKASREPYVQLPYTSRSYGPPQRPFFPEIGTFPARPLEKRMHMSHETDVDSVRPPSLKRLRHYEPQERWGTSAGGVTSIYPDGRPNLMTSMRTPMQWEPDTAKGGDRRRYSGPHDCEVVDLTQPTSKDHPTKSSDQNKSDAAKRRLLLPKPPAIQTSPTSQHTERSPSPPKASSSSSDDKPNSRTTNSTSTPSPTSPTQTSPPSSSSSPTKASSTTAAAPSPPPREPTPQPTYPPPDPTIPDTELHDHPTMDLNALHVTLEMWQRAVDIYLKVKSVKEIVSRQPEKKRQIILASILHILCRQEGLPRTFQEFAVGAGTTKKEIGAFFRILLPLIDTEGLCGKPVTADNFLKRWCDELRLPEEVYERATDVYKRAEHLGLTSGKCPTSVSSAVLYFVCTDGGMVRCPPYQYYDSRDFAAAAGVTNTTLQTSLKMLILHKRQLLDGGG
ncbi:Transcription initiation factor IIB [Rhizophlyctis rosea]|nr:Transcription initiation factor IIB [Rhizophlyctis rosea]